MNLCPCDSEECGYQSVINLKQSKTSVCLFCKTSRLKSAEQVRIWVDNFKSSLTRQKDATDKQSEPNDTK
jgi:hypothetical protein